nr:hypothetical protein CFP56_71719 [Quercus suber]
MSEVRSSDLKTGLSSSDYRVISEATFVSTPYKAWTISCSLMGKDEQQIRDRFQFPDFVKIRIPSNEERACHSYADEKTGDVSKKDSVTTIPPVHSPAKRPVSPTSSLEMTAYGREEIKKKKRASGKSFLPTFWNVTDAAALKAHEVLSVDDLSLLMAKSFGEALGESLFVYGKLLDLEKKVAMSEPLFKSLSIENKKLKNKVAILIAEAENDKERMVTLEKSLQVEKDFCKLKDKQVGDLELKLENVGATMIQDFKDFDEYSNELCKNYVEGFDLLVKWMAKHHPGLDLFGLAMDDVEKELVSAVATAENVIEEATYVDERMKEATVITSADPVPDEQ